MCVGSVQFKLRSLVKMSRDETEAGLRSHFECRDGGAADSSTSIKCGAADDVGGAADDSLLQRQEGNPVDRWALLGC